MPKEILGRCYQKEKIIQIQKHLRGEKKMMVFIHEVFHAIEEEYGVKINHQLLDKIDSAFTKFLIQNFTSF